MLTHEQRQQHMDTLLGMTTFAEEPTLAQTKVAAASALLLLGQALLDLHSLAVSVDAINATISYGQITTRAL